MPASPRTRKRPLPSKARLPRRVVAAGTPVAVVAVAVVAVAAVVVLVA